MQAKFIKYFENRQIFEGDYVILGNQLVLAVSREKPIYKNNQKTNQTKFVGKLEIFELKDLNLVSNPTSNAFYDKIATFTYFWQNPDGSMGSCPAQLLLNTKPWGPTVVPTPQPTVQVVQTELPWKE